MPWFAGSLDQEQINDLIAYRRELGKPLAGKKVQ